MKTLITEVKNEIQEEVVDVRKKTEGAEYTVDLICSLAESVVSNLDTLGKEMRHLESLTILSEDSMDILKMLVIDSISDEIVKTINTIVCTDEEVEELQDVEDDDMEFIPTEKRDEEITSYGHEECYCKKEEGCVDTYFHADSFEPNVKKVSDIGFDTEVISNNAIHKVGEVVSTNLEEDDETVEVISNIGGLKYVGDKELEETTEVEKAMLYVPKTVIRGMRRHGENIRRRNIK